MSAAHIEARLRGAEREGRTALLPYLMAGFPSKRGFDALLAKVAARADVVELGLPFTDPTADGTAIAAAARRALADGVHLDWLCSLVRSLRERIDAALVLMSYVNPLLAPGLERALDALAEAGFDGLIVPDAPLEESAELDLAASARGLARVHLATPLSPPQRRRALAHASRGFLYAVTRTGITGARTDPAETVDYLRELRELSPVPVCAGFGLSTPEHVRALAPHCAGVVVGSALTELLARGADPVPFLESLRDATLPPVNLR